MEKRLQCLRSTLVVVVLLPATVGIEGANGCTIPVLAGVALVTAALLASNVGRRQSFRMWRPLGSTGVWLPLLVGWDGLLLVLLLL